MAGSSFGGSRQQAPHGCRLLWNNKPLYPTECVPIHHCGSDSPRNWRELFFSKIDLKSAYHEVPIKLEDRPFSAFQAGGGLYQFRRLAFGLTNAVPAFQRIMEEFVQNYKLKKTFPYLDDITICGTTKEEHDTNLHHFLEAAKSANLLFNQDKCVFG